jgi:5-methylcytosine-specific restriction protein B
VSTAATTAPRLQPDHSLEKIADKTGRSVEVLARFVHAIEARGQAVLVGPAGAGKTFLAFELARHLVGGGDGFFEVLQLHASYTYEDFVQGHKPVLRPDGSTTWPLSRGRFLRFCDDARQRTGRCVLILDELQRADVGRVFGELLYLLERRGEPMWLARGEAPVDIPANVRILATMPSAAPPRRFDDDALRRRFAFLPVPPETEVLRRYHAKTGFRVEGLLRALARADEHLGPPMQRLGTSYFLRDDLARVIEDVWRFEVEPVLEERLEDRPEALASLRWDAVRGYFDV